MTIVDAILDPAGTPVLYNKDPKVYMEIRVER